MTCTSCEKRVERTVQKLEGVIKVKANFSGQYAEIEYQEELTSLSQIKAAINSVGYSTENSKSYKYVGIVIIAAAIALLGLNTGTFDMETKLNNASYAVLFVVGILTSIHCVGMCGGIMLSQTLKNEGKNKFEAMKPALLYNAGRVLSYSILGGIVGAIGSVFALSLSVQAGLQIFAGVFMIMMGFNMAGFSAFRKFQIKLPASVCKLQAKPRTPFLVGVLNGFMPCGPLQTMQIFALGTGSALYGSLSMFMFALGTVPLMLTFGAVSSLLSKGYTKKILKFSGILIIVLGLIMSNRGLALAGMNASPIAFMAKIGAFGTENMPGANAVKATIKDGVQYLNMTASYSGYVPNELYVQKDMPVKWIVDGKELSGCNKTIVIPELNVQSKLQMGLNTIDFTPGDEDLGFSCWMGMIRGTIKVVDDLEKVEAQNSDPATADSAPSSNATTQAESIYGNDINQVPTDRLIKKATIANEGQTVAIKGIGYELEPLIVVTKTGVPTKLSMDLSSYDYAEGNFAVVDLSNMQIITQFTGVKNMNEVDFTVDKSGSYGIYADEELIGILEFADNMDTVDLEQLRNTYLR